MIFHVELVLGPLVGHDYIIMSNYDPPLELKPAAIPLGFICDHMIECSRARIYKMIFTVSVVNVCNATQSNLMQSNRF